MNARRTRPSALLTWPKRGLLLRWGIIAFVLLVAIVSYGYFHGWFKQNPLTSGLYVNPSSNAANQAKEWQDSRPQDAAAMRELAGVPSSKWFLGDASYNVIHDYVAAANKAGKTPVVVAYNIPHRDCGQYSSGGASNAYDYMTYVNRYARAIGSLRAVVIVEPDALAHLVGDGDACVNDQQKSERYELLRYATQKFASLQRTAVYLDAGNSGWIKDITKMGDALVEAGVDSATGFSVNVSSFYPTDESSDYGNALSDQTGGKHFVIDTSRNGLGAYVNTAQPAFSWCNPPGRAIGEYPTVTTGRDRVDAYLHIKNIGESDGSDEDFDKCHGGPAAGTWWPDYALGLVQRWPSELKQ